MPAFVPGVDLADALYRDVVAPALGRTAHAAALVGFGSDVLGFDTARSTDHGWGPRLHVFVEQDAVDEVRSRVEASLPETFRGWPTRYGWDDVPVQSHVVVRTLADWLKEHLGFDPTGGVETIDWLTTPQQLLLEATAGPVMHDDTGELTATRERLAWYPRDVWLWLLVCQWRRLDQEAAFVGRTAEVGDELGSRMVTARLVRDIVRLCLLIGRRYAPYTKWLGSAFARLDVGAELGPSLERALAAPTYPAREEALVSAFEGVARHFNDAKIVAFVEPHVSLFHGRPYRVLASSRFIDACLDEVADPWLRGLPLIGGIDQLVDSTDILSRAERARRLAPAYLAATARPSATSASTT